jgi:hypothetical protein
MGALLRTVALLLMAACASEADATPPVLTPSPGKRIWGEVCDAEYGRRIALTSLQQFRQRRLVLFPKQNPPDYVCWYGDRFQLARMEQWAREKVARGCGGVVSESQAALSYFGMQTPP